MDYEIFVSYRRLDAQGNISGRDIARLLSKELKLYGYKTFFDYSELRDNDFEETIIPTIQHCKIFILVLTKDSLKRCVNAGDWVRREICEALKSGVKIIPVDPNYSFNGWPEDLPDELKPIKTIQISSVDMNSNFEVTIKSMIDHRIASSLPPRISVEHHSKSDKDVNIEINGRQFVMEDQFFNEDVFNALNRTYGEDTDD